MGISIYVYAVGIQINILSNRKEIVYLVIYNQSGGCNLRFPESSGVFRISFANISEVWQLVVDEDWLQLMIGQEQNKIKFFYDN